MEVRGWFNNTDMPTTGEASQEGVPVTVIRVLYAVSLVYL